ncbi:MAG: AEC family transporter [Desulfovibrionaceae bacterium]|nr:AEC family transporter [Desulfovibrionaceae bacterium]
MIFSDALASMMSITLLTLVGALLATMRMVTEDTERFLPKFIVNVALPPYLMSTILLHFDRSELVAMILRSAIPIVSMIVCYALFRAFSILLRIDKRHRGLFALAGTVSNTIIIGIPVNIAILGEQAVPNALLYFFANTLFFWVFGTSVLAREGTRKIKHSLLEHIRSAISPPLAGGLIGILLVVMNISLPNVLVTTCRYLGQLVTPLALIFVGITLTHMKHPRDYLQKDILLGIVLRLVAAPAVLIVFLAALAQNGFALPSLMVQSFIIQSALPCMAITPIVAAYYGADSNYASALVTLTTILCIVTVPVWMHLSAFFF